MTSEGDRIREDESNIEDLYAKPMKPKTKRRAPSIASAQSDQIYDRLDRQPVSRVVERDQRANNQRETVNDDTASVNSAPRSVVSQSARSAMSTDSNDENKTYPLDMLDTKDTNDVVKELRKLGLEDESDRLVLALRDRFELEGEFIQICSEDGVTVVEGDDDDDDDATQHQSIGGLRVKGMKPKYVNYDEYDPDIIEKYGQFYTGFSREEMANDAATLRRRAANLLWTVENMERMIDPNSRVRYVRHEGDL